MKKTILLFTLVVMGVYAQAQSYFSCTHRENYQYNVESNEYIYLSGFDEKSLFKMNEDMTMFEHTAPDISSTYYVSNSEFDESNNALIMDVVSDEGNEYRYFFDYKNKKIKVVFTRDDGKYLLIYTIKKYWKEKK